MGWNKEGDPKIIRVLFDYRFLQSGQIARLTGRSGPVIRRRIREILKPLGYVKELPREMKEEAVYALGREGFRYIAQSRKCSVGDLPYSRRGTKVKPHYWRHILLINDTCIDFQLASVKQPNLELDQTIPEWWIVKPKEKKGKKKFFLWESPKDVKTGRLFSFRPDAMFLCSYPGGNRMAMFLEADMGTESVAKRIRYKFNAYRCYFDGRYYSTKCHANYMCILFVLEDVKSDIRIRTMQRLLEKMAEELEDRNAEGRASFIKYFRFTRSELVNPETILSEPIWQNYKGESKSLTG